MFFTQGDDFIWMGIYAGLLGLILLLTCQSTLRMNLLSKPELLSILPQHPDSRPPAAPAQRLRL